MTILDKPVGRVTRQLHRGRPLVVVLHPAGYLELRAKGARTEVYRLSFDQALIEAARRMADQARADQARERRLHTR